MYKTYEHPADIGVYGEGKTLDVAFSEVAKAMLSVICEIDKIKKDKFILIEVESSNEEDLLFAWLNELLSEADINNMFFCECEVGISKSENKFKLKAKCFGDDRENNLDHYKVEVKAATYYDLTVKIEKNKFIAQCIVDV